MKKYMILWVALVFAWSGCTTEKEVKKVDVCIYGGTSAGVIAAYTARQYGKSVVLIEPGKHIGGMTTGGLGYTDIGNKYVVQGLARDFYRRLGKHYGKLEQWIFEPSVAESVFKEYIRRADVEIWFDRRITGVSKNKNRITQITVESTGGQGKDNLQHIAAEVFIDCSYEGDLMARSGVSYTIGREDNTQYGETYNGVQLMDGHQFPDGIDPYIVPGNKESGLLWGISEDTIHANGTGDQKIQAYNYRIVLTNRPDNRVPVTRPLHYDPSKYELLIRLKEKQPWKSLNDVFIWNLMPNGKTDINNRGGFSTDMIGMNWNYPEAGYEEREKIREAHEEYTKGLLYFIGNDPRIPETIRNEMQKWGYPKDEFCDNGNWTPQLYVRESRRMIGETVMTQHHCTGKRVCEDAIGWAAYTMDSHNCDRHVVDGMVKNEGNVEIGGFPPYPVSYGAIIPKRPEADNLLVPVCLSASHIAYGSIRMEPVFMVLAQSAAVAACMAIDDKTAVQEVDIRKLQAELQANPLADRSIPEILIDNDDERFVRTTGTWSLNYDTYRAYGRNFFMDESKGKDLKAVRYTPEIKTGGNYDLYTYFPKLADETTQTPVSIFDGKRIHTKVIRHTDVEVEGQTSGEWVYLGKYQLPKGDSMYVEISNKGADNTVVADAVLFLPAGR